MPTPRDHSAAPHGRPPTASAELLPMLVWLNRLALASRFPAWQPTPPGHAGREPATATADEPR